MTDPTGAATSPREPDPRWLTAIDKLVANVETVIVGKHELVRLALVPLLARGHLLVEDVPGVGKTMLARCIARSIAAGFRRVQFTPDLMPLDITGSSVFRPNSGEFEFREGPVFTEVLLADEINRATPRTQSALLECMAERQVTVDGHTYSLPKVFLVLATLNPVEQMGTYHLPEAQLDRFLLRLSMGYPAAEDEEQILAAQQQQVAHPIDALQPAIDVETVLELQQAVTAVALETNVRRYIVSLAQATRDDDRFHLGISPRGSLALMRSAQARALMAGRMYVTPGDVQAMARHVWPHRLMLDPQAALSGATVDDELETIIEQVDVPWVHDTVDMKDEEVPDDL